MSGRLNFKKGLLFHMTLIERLPLIVSDGQLVCDAALAHRDLPGQSIGHAHLKARRLTVEVPVPPGGVVGDYVPFYLAPRSPMLYASKKGGVDGRTTGQDGIVYLITTIDRVAGLGGVVLTSKHPLRKPRFSADLTRFEDESFIDWGVMVDMDYRPRENDTERTERRQAEVLIHNGMPLTAVVGLAARTSTELAAARDVCEPMCEGWYYKARPDWYY